MSQRSNPSSTEPVSVNSVSKEDLAESLGNELLRVSFALELLGGAFVEAEDFREFRLLRAVGVRGGVGAMVGSCE